MASKLLHKVILSTRTQTRHDTKTSLCCLLCYNCFYRKFLSQQLYFSRLFILFFWYCSNAIAGQSNEVLALNHYRKLLISSIVPRPRPAFITRKQHRNGNKAN